MPACDPRLEISTGLQILINRIITALSPTHMLAELVMRAPSVLAYLLRLYHALNPAMKLVEVQSVDATLTPRWRLRALHMCRLSWSCELNWCSASIMH
jgi:hypothetical protein